MISSHKFCEYLIVVLNENYSKHYKIKNTKKNIVFITGGESRHESVFKAIKVLPKNNFLLLIHDAARPGIDHLIIDKLINSLSKEFSGVVPTLPISDSIIKKDKILSSVKRENLYRIQTPQIFSANVLSLKDFDKYGTLTPKDKGFIKFKL